MSTTPDRHARRREATRPTLIEAAKTLFARQGAEIEALTGRLDVSHNVCGPSMNPARSFGPARVSGDWSAYWVCVAGAVVAVGCAVILRGRGGDPTARLAASGSLGR